LAGKGAPAVLAETVDVDGQSVVLVEGIDISDRKKRPRRRLRRSENKFIKVYQSSPEAITISSRATARISKSTRALWSFRGTGARS
jgi:hypothetical protein